MSLYKECRNLPLQCHNHNTYNEKVSFNFTTERFHNMRRDVYQAIADPTRREILHMIAHRRLSINLLSANFNISRTAVCKHLKILTECGLLVIKQNGRERYCEPRLDKLSEVSDWVKQYKKFWATRFGILDNYLKVRQTKKAVKIYKKKTKHLTND